MRPPSDFRTTARYGAGFRGGQRVGLHARQAMKFHSSVRSISTKVYKSGANNTCIVYGPVAEKLLLRLDATV